MRASICERMWPFPSFGNACNFEIFLKTSKTTRYLNLRGPGKKYLVFGVTGKFKSRKSFEFVSSVASARPCNAVSYKNQKSTEIVQTELQRLKRMG